MSKLLIELAKAKQAGRSLTDLIATLKEPKESREIRLKIGVNEFKSYGEGVIEQLKAFVKEQSDWSLVSNNYEGIRVACSSSEEDGWFLLRLSLHDPVLPLNVESNVEGGVDKIVERLLTFFNGIESLDLSAF
mgnify:CR=1 FL=1